MKNKAQAQEYDGGSRPFGLLFLTSILVQTLRAGDSTKVFVGVSIANDQWCKRYHYGAKLGWADVA